MPDSPDQGLQLPTVKPSHARSFAAAAEFSPLPFLLCDARGKVLATTRGARHLAQASELIDTRGLKLQLPTRALQQELLDMLRSAMGAAASDALILKLERENQPPLVLMVCAPPGHSAPPVAVYLHDPSEPPRISETTLCKLYQLTPAEARVARIMVNGHDTREIARQNGTSVHTVRNQIKKVFAKTGISRQAELAILIMGGPAHTR